MADIKGLFDGKKVLLLETPPVREPCTVVVSFEPKSQPPKTLREILEACGPWEDDRPAKEIAAELRQLRRSRVSKVGL